MELIHRAFAVHDAKAQAFHMPFFYPTTAMAERAFMQQLRDTEHPFSQTPEDFTLYEIGHFDQDDGTLHERTPVAVMNGKTGAYAGEATEEGI